MKKRVLTYLMFLGMSVLALGSAIAIIVILHNPKKIYISEIARRGFVAFAVGASAPMLIAQARQFHRRRTK